MSAGRAVSAARAAAAVHALAVLAVVVAPAVVVRAAGERAGGIAGGTDLLAVGAAVGVVAALVAWRRLTTQGDAAPADRCIAALGALGVLATGATAVPAVALHWLNGVAGGPALAPITWGGALALAVYCSDVVQRRLLRWLTQSAPGPAQPEPTVSAARSAPRAGGRDPV